MPSLGSVAGTLGHYQATVGAARQDWAATHRATLVAFLRAYRKAVAWMVAPAHKDAAIAILHDEMPSLDPAMLGRVYALVVDPRDGIERDLAIDPAGAAMVLTLRARYAAAARPGAGLAPLCRSRLSHAASSEARAEHARPPRPPPR